MSDYIQDAANAAGSVRTGGYRVVVRESDGRLTVRDFDGLQEARSYADDAASEADGLDSPIAYVFDDRLEYLERGAHYSLRVV